MCDLKCDNFMSNKFECYYPGFHKENLEKFVFFSLVLNPCCFKAMQLKCNTVIKILCRYLARYENGYFSILIVLFKKLWVLIHQSFGLAVFKCFLNKHSLIFAVFKIWKCNWQSIVKVYFVNKFRCCQIPTIKLKPQQWNMVFSRKCDSLHTITYVCAFVGLSVCTSESKTPEDLTSEINHSTLFLFSPLPSSPPSPPASSQPSTTPPSSPP